RVTGDRRARRRRFAGGAGRARRPITGSHTASTTLTSNVLNGTSSPILSAFFDPGDTQFGLVDSIGSASFTSSATITRTAFINATGPFSATAANDVMIGAAGGSVNNTINVSATGPVVGAGWPCLLAACAGLIAFARRRRRQLA